MACVGKCVWGFITHYIIGTIVRWWVPHKTNSTYGMCKFACSKSYVEMNWWVFFSVCTMRDKLNGRDMNVKSPRTWHNSLLERLYWLVWIMCLIWFNICQWSNMTAILCNKIMWNQGTGWQIGIHHSPLHPPQRCLRQSTWPFSTPTWGTPPKKKTHPPPTH